jgi:hypothetical protein
MNIFFWWGRTRNCPNNCTLSLWVCCLCCNVERLCLYLHIFRETVCRLYAPAALPLERWQPVQLNGRHGELSSTPQDWSECGGEVENPCPCQGLMLGFQPMAVYFTCSVRFRTCYLHRGTPQDYGIRFEVKVLSTKYVI